MSAGVLEVLFHGYPPETDPARAALTGHLLWGALRAGDEVVVGERHVVVLDVVEVGGGFLRVVLDHPGTSGLPAPGWLKVEQRT